MSYQKQPHWKCPDCKKNTVRFALSAGRGREDLFICRQPCDFSFEPETKVNPVDYTRDECTTSDLPVESNHRRFLEINGVNDIIQAFKLKDS